MIEKLDKNLAGNINSFNMSQNILVAHKAIEKINEIVDLLNAIVVDVDGTKCVDGSKTPADPYTEQRKWIGKLCRFSNGDGFDEVGYLTEIDPDMPEAKFRCNCHDYYKECKPVKPDDPIIYKGEHNE